MGRVFAYLIELIIVVEIFVATGFVKIGPPLTWVAQIPLSTLVGGYVLSLVLRLVGGYWKFPPLQILGWTLLFVAVLARPLASNLTTG